MANAFYPSGRLAIADQSVDLIGDDLQMVALGSGYTFNSIHSVRSDLADELGTATSLAGKTWLSDAIFDTDNVSYPGVLVGETVRKFAFFVNTGVASTSPLICYIDQKDDGGSIAIAGTGAPLPILFSDSTYRVFRL